GVRSENSPLDEGAKFQDLHLADAAHARLTLTSDARRTWCGLIRHDRSGDHGPQACRDSEVHVAGGPASDLDQSGDVSGYVPPRMLAVRSVARTLCQRQQIDH